MNTIPSRLLCLLACGVQCAIAQGTFIYDQQSASSGFALGGAAIQAARPVGQSFTPASTFVGFAQLQFSDTVQNNGLGSTVVLNLREGSIVGTLLGTSAPVSMPNNFWGTATFIFPANVTVTPGIAYYFEPVLQAGDDTAAMADFYNYSGGAFISAGQQTSSGLDLWFREGYFVPEPAATSLALVGTLAILVFRRKAMG